MRLPVRGTRSVALLCYRAVSLSTYPPVMQRRWISLLVASLVCLVPASASAALSRDRATFEMTDTLPTEMCGFPLTFSVRGTTDFRVWVGADGEIAGAMSSGRIWITFRRDDTNAQARYAIPGPSFYDAHLDLIGGTGRWFAISAEGHPVILAGDWTFPGGMPDGSGSVIDVCDALS